MALALIYPEPEKGGRGRKSLETKGFSAARLSQARAVAILPSSQWRGYQEPPEAPVPEPGTWGDHPCGMRDPMTEAEIEQRQGGGIGAMIRQLELGERGSTAAALASLGRAFMTAKP